ncbi:MAG: hypothetical protein ACLTQR_03585 [Methanobrevibacter smithii]
MVKSFKTNILTWLKTKTYIKTEIDELLQLKSNIGHTHTNASTTTPGFLSAEDKTKLNNLEQITVDSSINATSTNPVQNKVINTALTGKANTNHTHSITNITNLQSQLDGKANSVHTHDDRYYTETEINTKLNGKANSSHTHNISDVTGLSTSLDGKMGNNYKVSAVTGADNMYAHRIGDIVILSWWGRSVSTTDNWQDWKTLPYPSANTQHIWTSVYSTDTSVRVRIPPNSDKIQINVSGNGHIDAGFIVYPTK